MLNECGVGLGEYVKVKGADAEPRKGFLQYLQCERVNGKRRVCVVWNEAGTYTRDSLKPWSDCSRTEKLQTVNKLPELLDRINSVVKSQLAVAEAAKPAVDRVRKILGTHGEGQ